MPGDRSVLTGAFGPAVFETYGSRETMLMAAECEAHDGMHIQEENVLVEILRSGRAVRPGETGDVVITDLHNLGMPMIRYVNGDIATMAEDEACTCGRTLARIARVDGRRADTLTDLDGNAVGCRFPSSSTRPSLGSPALAMCAGLGRSTSSAKSRPRTTLRTAAPRSLCTA